MTLDKLARMTQDGFDELKTELKGEVSGLKGEVGGLKGEVSELRGEMNSRFMDLEGKIESYTSFWHRKFSEHEAWLQNLDKSVAYLERHVGIGKKR